MKKEYTDLQLAAFLGTLEINETTDRVRGKSWGTYVTLEDCGFVIHLNDSLNGEFKDVRHGGVKIEQKHFDGEHIKEVLDGAGAKAIIFITESVMRFSGKVETVGIAKIRKRGEVWVNEGVKLL